MPCQHYWECEPVAGPVSGARCRRCGQEQELRNCIPWEARADCAAAAMRAAASGFDPLHLEMGIDARNKKLTATPDRVEVAGVIPPAGGSARRSVPERTRHWTNIGISLSEKRGVTPRDPVPATRRLTPAAGNAVCRQSSSSATSRSGTLVETGAGRGRPERRSRLPYAGQAASRRLDGR